MSAVELRCDSCGQPQTPGSRFCNACGTPIAASGETATSPAPAVRHPVPVRVPSESAQGARFLPGTMLAGRYRVAGLLGRGGMGEVYRADDLKLGQQVALKFLPADVERDAERLERFLTEVRLSLRVTHPNVCRVHDLGQIDHRYFLSMEYVDGEDLASLLRRIGRLPEDKAIEIARQLCAGLAAAHDEGVLHRDLKPANIMIDGRGRAKIADFGLAGATAGITGGEARAGTPQYMAPEQVAGRELSERTDLYALGLVLYEVFTGKRAFEIKNLDDLERLKTSTPTNPSSHVSGLNPLVERAILRCLDADPLKRPTSASALAAALPGGDPLAMALAAGDTPSPEMVAAAGTDARLRPAVAWTLLAISLAGMLAAATLAGRVVLFRAAAPVKPPDVFVERSREMLRAAGFTESPQDSAWGLDVNFNYLNYLSSGTASSPALSLDGAVAFWYRESPVLIERYVFLNPDTLPRVGFNDPALRYSGEVRVSLDRHGRLVLLTAMPPQRATPAEAGPEPNWAALFGAAGLDLNAWMPAAPEWTPLFFGDRRVAWVPRAGSAPGPIRVEGTSFQGHPVQFAVISPWTVPERMQATRRTPGERVGNLIGVLIFSALMFGSALVARRNMRLDRTDWRGATRLAFFVMTLLLVVWFLDESHVASIWELYLFIMSASWTLFIGGLTALLYLALEPYVRRLWPTTIVSWSRIIAGTIRDPLVARDVLIGCAAGGVIMSVGMAGFVVSGEVSGLPPRVFSSVRPFLGAPQVASEVAMLLFGSIFFALVYLFVLFALRQLLRREWIAVVVGAAIISVPNAMGSVTHPAGMPLLFVGDVLAFTLLARVGLVAMIAANVAGVMMMNFPVTLGRTEWYSGTGFVGLALMAALAIASFRIATAGAPKHQGAGNVPSTPS